MNDLLEGMDMMSTDKANEIMNDYTDVTAEQRAFALMEFAVQMLRMRAKIRRTKGVLIHDRIERSITEEWRSVRGQIDQLLGMPSN